MTSPAQLRAAWVEFIDGVRPTHAVTIAYNNHCNGTSAPCYRITPDGECLKLRSGSSTAHGHRLTTIRYISLATIHDDLRRLHRNVDRKLFGSRFNHPSSLRTYYRGFIEHADSNVHAHLAWRVPEVRCAEFHHVVQERWLAQSPHHSIKITTATDEGWARYICKKNDVIAGEAALFVSDPISRA